MKRLATRIADKPWGRRGIDPIFGADPARQVGEIWFEPPADRPLDVMAKYLFTTERLSIQVHPDDELARRRGHPRGKSECWIVLDAAEDAELGIGTVREIDPADLIAAARDGSIVDLIDWRKPEVGDFIYNPAGTIHALGPGLTVLEIQQAIDLTYRLYDYGRPRELHLTEAEAAMRPRPHAHPLDGPVGEISRILVEGPAFGAAWCVNSAPPLPANARDVQLLPIDTTVAGIQSGECALLDDGEADRLVADGRFVLAWTAS